MTPLTIGVFVLMAVTGGLMFFHLDSNLQKALHEWLGWLMVAVVVGHAMANWLGFKRYFKLPGKGAGLIGVCVLVLAGSLVQRSGAREGAPPPIVALRAVSGAPLRLVAPLAGKSIDEARLALAQAGFDEADAESTLERLSAGDRERLAQAMSAVFVPPARR